MSPKLEKYELLGEIGHGGMATVYRALDRRLGREVAVKIIHRHLRENREVAQRFNSEARAVAKLKHPNIVEVYDVSDPGEEERYLVVELVRGVTLRQLLTAQSFLPPEVASAVGIELADALEHAHELGVIHRDVKPENVLVSSVGTDPDAPLVKITDFGIAKLLDAQGVTSTGQVLGSPAHMAPEQIEGGEVTARSDVFGLGVLLYECMVGRLPFDGKNPAQVLRRVLDGTFVPADRARPSVGAGYAAVLARALAHDPAERFATTAELAAALRDQLAQVSIETPRRELHAFLSDPDRYRAEHEPRIVRELVERARRAREAKDVPLAAACYNRALAYRPNDPELLASISKLSRTIRTRRWLERGAVALAGALVLGAGATAVARWNGSRARRAPPPTAPLKSADLAPVLPQLPASATSGALPQSSAVSSASAGPLAPVSAGRKPSRTVRSAGEQEPNEERMARVQILVDGPQNATVRIDGAERPWFGVIQELTPGEHTIDFVPPDEQCCESGQTLRVKVPVSTGPGDVHTVRGRIEFRPAILELRGTAGTTASCGALGEFPVPSQHQIPMPTPTLTVRCQLIPPPGSAEPPKEFDVMLRPGRLSTNLGQ